MIECEWQAWYDRLPGSSNRLHVAGMCEVESQSVRLRLVRDDAASEAEPDMLVLTLMSEPPDAGEKSLEDKQVSWTGEPVAGIKRVRIEGETAVTVTVSDAA
jgi:hypothetical protein